MKEIRLYNAIFPLYLLLFMMPPFCFIIPTANFVIDSLVVIIVSSIMFKRFDKSFYWKTIWKVWGLGYLSDIIGVAFVFLTSQIGYAYINIFGHSEDDILSQIMSGLNNVTNHLDLLNVYSMLDIGMGVIVAGVAIFLFDYFIAFRKTEMTKKQKLVMSLSLAIFTAPYTFFLPNPQY